MSRKVRTIAPKRANFWPIPADMEALEVKATQLGITKGEAIRRAIRAWGAAPIDAPDTGPPDDGPGDRAGGPADA